MLLPDEHERRKEAMLRELFEGKDGDEPWRIVTRTSYVDQGRPLKKLATLENLADFCDLEAEDRNNHEYVGAHKLLAIVLFQQVGRAVATRIILEIAQRGGLDGMGGIGGQPSSYEELGVKDDWSPWSLPKNRPEKGKEKSS